MKEQMREEVVQIKQFTFEEIDRAIIKINRRLEEVESLKEAIIYKDQRVENAEVNIRETIREVYGQLSPEFIKYQYYNIWEGEYVDDEPFYKMQLRFQGGISQAHGMLSGLIIRLNEKREDLQEDPKLIRIQTFNGLNIHKRIFAVCSDLFKDGHFSSAVFEASKSLINYVKEKSNRYDLDGTGLVRTVFSKKDPILCFNGLIDQTDLDEQEGIMHLFEGVVMGIRNPRGHDNIMDNPDRAMDYIILISLLTYRIEDAVKV